MKSRLAAAALVALSILYLALFVPRGWIPHDEGMIGQSAERVLTGQMPHVDYVEPYTGGLTWMHAVVFKLAGIDLLYPRWLLFAGAVMAQLLAYLLLRRFLQPVAAAAGSWLALAWSFPNYFAALPSWWLLVCALACTWALLKHVETGLLRYAAIAGLAAGTSVLIKQTGLYLVVALIISLLYSGETAKHNAQIWWPGRILCAGVAVIAAALATMIIAARPALSDLLYLLLPIAACSRVLLVSDARLSCAQSWRALTPPAIAAGVAALPLVCFAIPYVIDGQVSTFVNGVFILPRKRVQFAAMEMPAAFWMLAGVPLLATVMPLPAFVRARASGLRLGGALLCVAGPVLFAASFSDMTSYQLLWQSARGFAALLPVVICGIVMSEHAPSADDGNRRRMLFALAAFLSWASLVQVPFSAPIYFCYVAPLAVIAGAALASHSAALARPALGVSAAVLLVFALFSLNRGYVYSLGAIHGPFDATTPLRLQRATLTVSDPDAISYRRVIKLIDTHIAGGQLVAGPDTPEVYFLSGRFSPSGALFDFFTEESSPEGGLNDMTGLADASVVVLNHGRRFSVGPSADLAARVRRMFPYSEGVGTLEVRWR